MRSREINSSAFFSFIADDVVIGHMINEDMQFFHILQLNFKEA